MSEIKSQIFLWDSPEKLSFKVSKNETILFWQQFNIDDDENIFSVPDLIDKDSDYLRAKYLKWISKLGETKVDAKTFIEILKIRKNFSAWWMSLIVEKSNFAKSTDIDEIIRLMLLDKLIKKNSVSKIIIYRFYRSNILINLYHQGVVIKSSNSTSSQL